MTPWFASSVSSPSAEEEPLLSVAQAVKFLKPPQPATNVRFSLLLLEFGEMLLQDWAVVLSTTNVEVVAAAESLSTKNKNKSGQQQRTKTKQQRAAAHQPSNISTRLQGRLHLCTKSLVFEPDEPMRPIWRFPFSRMEAPPKEVDASTGSSSLGDSYEIPLAIHFLAKRYFTMKENNTIGPYETRHSSQVQITFLHSSPPTLVKLCHKLSSNPSPEDLEEILKPMLQRPFDLSHLKSVGETPVTPSLRAQLVSPLQKQPGALLVTTEGLYFQLATLGDEGGLVSSWLLSDTRACARRYAGLKDCAIELYWQDGTSTLFAVEKARDREKIMQALPTKARCLTDRDFMVSALEEWNAGRLSNLDYLLAVNSAAGRTFHDLSRYPVVPWILSDYSSETLDLNDPNSYRDLSKPMGAMEEKRLAYFETRLRGMHQDGMEHSFLYGTHYSAPGYILYYLVRSMPQHMLCLQNGKFDSPDRMFYSIQQCYDCALTNHADVKELIPEFYLDYDFLINAQSLQLGATQLGDRVHDVQLPPWAKSARHFLKESRKALESNHVSIMLPQWIDLIFGSRSRGDAALEAQNLFHPTAYLGPADLATLGNEEDRFQAELQAGEFGTVPDQIFTIAHPVKGASAFEGDNFVSATLGKVLSDLEGLGGGEHNSNKQEAWELLEPPSSQDENISFGTTDNGEEQFTTTKQLSSSVVSSSVSFGVTMLPSSAQMKRFSNKLSPIRKTEYKDSEQPQRLVTPGGKAKASWVSSSLTGPVESPVTNHTPISYRKDIFLQQPSLATTTQPKYRTIGLSGSGELSSARSKDLSFGGGSQQTKRNQQHQSPHNSPTRRNNNSVTGWDMKMLEKKKIHSDAVSGCSLFFHAGDSFLTTVSLDGSMLVNTVTLSTSPSNNAYNTTTEDVRRSFTGTLSRFYGAGLPQPEKAHSTLAPYRTHTASDPLACLSLTDDGYGGNLVFAGGHDDVVLAYGINSACAVASVYSHRDAVTGLDVIARSPLLAESALWSDMATHIMVSGSWDATVKVWSIAVSAGETVAINREPLAELFDADSTIVCLSATIILSSGAGVAICTGCSDGSFVVWQIHDDGTKVVIHKEPARRGAGPCAAVKWTQEHGETFLFAGFSNGRLSSFLLVSGNLIKVSAVSVGVAVTCLEYAHGTLLVGCADGGLRLLPIRDGASFDGKPTLWNAVNGLSSPGLCCSSIGFHQGRFLCATGADDGSVAIFELKKDDKKRIV